MIGVQIHNNDIVQHISHYITRSKPKLCLYIYIYIYIKRETHIYTFTHIYIYTHMHTNLSIYLSIYTYIYIYIERERHTHTHVYIHIYIYIYIHKYMYTYFEECIFRQQIIITPIFLKMMEHCLLFLIVIFLVFLLFFLCQDPGGKGIVLNLLPKHFQQYFWSSSGLCSLSWLFEFLLFELFDVFYCRLECFQPFVLKHSVGKVY